MDERVLEYQRSRQGLDRLVNAVAELVYTYPAGRRNHDERDGAELLLAFYPRIRRLIERYRPNGSSFENYLRSSLRWQLRSLAKARAASEAKFRLATSNGTSEDISGPLYDLPTAQAGADTTEAGKPHPRPVRSRRQPRKRPPHRPSVLALEPPEIGGCRLTAGEAQRLLCLFLKSCDGHAEDRLPALARITGCDAQWLADRYAELMERTLRYRERQERFRGQRDRAWFALRCVEDRLRFCSDSERAQLEVRSKRLSERYHNAITALQRTSHSPTHTEIAEVLGIKKGTVDSSIFKAREEIRSEAFRERVAALLHHP